MNATMTQSPSMQSFTIIIIVVVISSILPRWFLAYFLTVHKDVDGRLPYGGIKDKQALGNRANVKTYVGEKSFGY